MFLSSPRLSPAWVFIVACLTSIPQSTSATSPSLVVYTYSSFFSGWNWTQAFEAYAGLPIGSTYVYKTADANELLKAIVNPPSGVPAPDVVAGLDNVLEIIAPQVFIDVNVSTTFAPLIGTLGHIQHNKPYDYGLIAITYDQTRLTVPQASNFSLERLVTNSTLLSKFGVGDPSLSSTGLAFLMWTIAVYGDSQLNITGVRNGSGDWRHWWTRAFSGSVSVYDSWGAAYNDLTAGKINAFTSYGTDAATNVCTGSGNTLGSLLSLDNNSTTPGGWVQVEGVSIVNSTTNLTRSQQFVNFLLSPVAQNQTALFQYMLPAVNNTPIPSCYSSAVLPSSVTLLNGNINSYLNSTNINNWLTEWASLRTTYTPQSKTSDASPHFATSLMLQTIVLLLGSIVMLALSYNK